MRVKIPLALLLLLAAAIGYLLGTERGRSQRDVILVKLGRKAGDEEEPAPAAETIGTEAAETIAEDAETIAEDAETVAEETETAAGEATEPTG